MHVCVYNYIIMCLGVLCCCTYKDVGVFSYIKVRLLFASKLAGVLWQSSLQRSLHTLFTFVRTGFALPTLFDVFLFSTTLVHNFMALWPHYVFLLYTKHTVGKHNVQYMIHLSHLSQQC